MMVFLVWSGHLKHNESSWTMKPRVVHLINSLYSFGGAERLICEFVRINQESPPAVILIWNAKPSLLDNFSDKGVDVAVLLPPRISQLKRAKAMLEASDIVHVHLSPAQLLGCLLNKPKLFTQHNSWNRRRSIPMIRRLDRLIYACYDRVVGVSRAVTHDIMSWCDGTPDRFRTVVNGIDLCRFSATPRPWVDRLAKGEIRIGMVARFTANKDHACLLRALARLPDRFSLDLVGAGRLEDRLRATVSALGIENRVRIHSILDDMPAFYRSIDLYVHSSRFDGFSLVVAEAMAAGVPVLASDIDGLRDTVGNAEQCFVPGDDAQLAKLITSVCASKESFEGLARRGVIWAHNFSSSRMASEYWRLYKEMAGFPEAETCVSRTNETGKLATNDGLNSVHTIG